MLQVVIGTQANQYIPQKVLEYSIRKHCAEEVDLRFVTQHLPSVGGTKFGFVRFLVPQTFGYRGRAVYMDADQVVLDDLQKLVDSLDETHAVGIVRHIEGSFAGAPVEPRNETSVMVLDCAKLTDWDPDTMFRCVVPNGSRLGPGQVHYKDFIRLAWLDPARIQEIDPRWNHYNMVRDDSKLVHFSHVKQQPWKSPRHPLTGFWERWLSEAIEHGYVSRADIWRSAARLHLHPHFIRHGIRARSHASRGAAC